MKSIHLRALSVLTSLALIAGMMVFSPTVLAAPDGPTIVLSSASATTTNVASIPITAVFSESVEGFTLADISPTNATVSDFSGSEANYSFSLVPSTDGTVTVQVLDDIATSSTSSIGNQASNMLTFMSDRTPAVIIQVTSIPATTTIATPFFAFSSTEAGTINLSGGCTSTTTAATVGTTTIQFNALANGSYTCALTVIDAVTNVSNSLPITFSVAVPTLVAPIISNISVLSSSTSTASIMWMTDAAATSQVFYGTSDSYGSSTPLDSTATTTHTVTLEALNEATLYHFQVVSTNAGGTATSSDQVFTTGSTASTTPLAVTGVDSIAPNAIANGTFASGWKWVLHFVIPSNETFFRMKFSNFTTPSSSSEIPVANNVRYFSPQSNNASTEGSAILETDTNYGGALILNGDTSTTTPGRQIDVTVEAAVPSGTPTGVYSTIFGALSTTTL